MRFSCVVTSVLAVSWLCKLWLDAPPPAPQGLKKCACNCHWFAYSQALRLTDWLWSSGVLVRYRQEKMHLHNYFLCFKFCKCTNVENNNKTYRNYLISVCRTIFLVLLFSQYARNVHFPLPIYKAKKGWTSYRLQVFKMFPVSAVLMPTYLSFFCAPRYETPFPGNNLLPLI